MMSASSSATTRTSLRSIPILVRYSAIKPMFLSLVRPDRISSPITRMPAVTISFMTSPRRLVHVPAKGTPADICSGNPLKSWVFAAEISTGQPFFRATSPSSIANALRECISRWPGPCYHPFLSCTVPHGLEEQSGSMAVAFDEMNGPGGDLRPAYMELSRWLKETPPDALEYRRHEAELLFRRIGITFAVYGDAEAQERQR